MKHIFIINPAAGKGKEFAGLCDRIQAVCEERGEDYEIYRTRQVGDATDFVRRTCKETTVPCRFYACGGDGTVNETVNGAVGFDHAQVAVLPIGTGNDFVRNFSPDAPFLDVEAQLDGQPIAVDLLKYNDRYSINMLNIGFDCEVVKKTALLKRHPLVHEKMAYVAGILSTLIKKPGIHLSCRVDGDDLKRKTLLLAAFANGSFYGGGFKPTPYASISDGLIDACFIKDVSRTRFVSLIGLYKKGTHVGPRRTRDILEYIKCREIDILFDTPQSICVDGEIELTSSVHMEIAPQKLMLSLPRGVASLPDPEAVPVLS